MDIRTYLKDRDIPLSRMAQLLGLPVATLHGYSVGRRGVPVSVVAEVEKITKGRVKAQDWVFSEKVVRPEGERVR
ncbi:hypothetical protein [Komagataeibacter europaeus]|uniref:hypothetical protein n=1 Tax=Komagataeibacter europaeus TaxID=33995 RepID=UPI0015F93CB8|nr:hypothetical protein [Komagataeibacter europaeus]